MVSYNDVLNNNDSLKVAGSGLTAVFVGGTNGIGKAAVTALTKHTDSPTIYIMGRDMTRLESQISELKSINSTAKFIPIRAVDLTLVAEAKRAAEEISKTASKIDLLIMSPGYISGTREESPEGLDKLTAVRYYSRMQILVTLTPLLRAAPSPRVVSVLGAGQEGKLWADDLLLKDHYSIVNAAGASGSMSTLFLEEYAKEKGNEKIVFVHLFPGLVGDTGLTFQNIGWFFELLLKWVAVPIMKLVGYTAEEAGERVIFAATSGRFRKLQEGANAAGSLVQEGSNGKVGSGVYLVLADSNVVSEKTVKPLKQLKSEDMGRKVYTHTLDVFGRLGSA